MLNGFIRLLCVAMLLVVLSRGLSAQGVQTITLVDGTVLRGEVVEMNNNMYRIQTTSVGEVLIPADRISSISRGEAVQDERWQSSTHQERNTPVQTQPRAGQPTHEQENINVRVQSMMMNENFLNRVMSLSQSEAWLDVLSDPEVMALIESLDYEALMNNEKMQRLMNSPDTRSLFDDVGY